MANIEETIKQYGSASKVELQVPVVDKKESFGIFSLEALINIVDLELEDFGDIEFEDAKKLLIALATRNGYFRTMELSNGNMGVGYIHHGPNFNMEDPDEVKAVEASLKRAEESRTEMKELIKNAK